MAGSGLRHTKDQGCTTICTLQVHGEERAMAGESHRVYRLEFGECVYGQGLHRGGYSARLEVIQ